MRYLQNALNNVFMENPDSTATIILWLLVSDKDMLHMLLIGFMTGRRYLFTKHDIHFFKDIKVFAKNMDPFYILLAKESQIISNF